MVIPSWDQQLGSLTGCLYTTLRMVGGAPTYLLTDNAKMVTIEHVAGVLVRHPQMVALGRHYGCKIETCVPFDPETKGGVEATVKIAKADLVPAQANLRAEYASFAELEGACREWCAQVNCRVHRETAAIPRTGWPSSVSSCARRPPGRMCWRLEVIISLLFDIIEMAASPAHRAPPRHRRGCLRTGPAPASRSGGPWLRACLIAVIPTSTAGQRTRGSGPGPNQRLPQVWVLPRRDRMDRARRVLISTTPGS